jgi:hypothetical protein
VDHADLRLRHCPIQHPIPDRLGDMLVADRGGAVEISDRPRDAEDPVVGPARMAQPIGCHADQPLSAPVRDGVALEMLDRHLAVRVDAGVAGEALG